MFVFYKVRTKNELYVYHRGILIYKRWINKSYGHVFH
jgi:hypothetical protein